MATYAMSREASVTRGDTRRLRIVERSSESAPGSAMPAPTVTLLLRLGARDRPARRHDLDSGARGFGQRLPSNGTRHDLRAGAWCRVDTGVLEDLPDGGGGDLDTDDGEPPWILRYPQALFSRPCAGPVANPPNGSWPPDPDGSGDPGVPPGNQVAMPAQHGLWTHQQADAAQDLARQPV
jgi:hypothetical protein